MNEHPTPWHMDGTAIRDRDGFVVPSALNPCGMSTRLMIVGAVNEHSEKKKRKEKSMSRIFGDGTSPMSNFAYIVNEMREVVENKMSAGREMTADERAVEEFMKDMIADWADCLARQYKKIGYAVLDFCTAFTLVYPPNDKDCPALLAGAFDRFKEAMGIETVKCEEEGGAR